MIDNDYKEEEGFVSDKYAHHPFPDKAALHIDDIDKTFMTSLKQQIEILSNHVETVKNISTTSSEHLVEEVQMYHCFTKANFWQVLLSFAHNTQNADNNQQAI